MSAQHHALHTSAELLIPPRARSPQSLEALDDLLRPAPPLPRTPHFFRVHFARIDWTAAGAAGYIYGLAFLVWLYLAQ